MRLRIRHTTTYTYASPVAASTQVVRLSPRDDPGQRILSWEVGLAIVAPPTLRAHPLRLGAPTLPIAQQSAGSPGNSVAGVVSVDPHALGTLVDPPDRLSAVFEWGTSVPVVPTGDDGYGNRTHLVSLVSPHIATRLVATGVVETMAEHQVTTEHAHSLPASYWLRHTRHTATGGGVDRFVHESGLTSWHGRDAIWVTGHLDDLMHRVRERIDFKVGATDVLTTAGEALRRGAGVCQDHAHVMIAVARSLGIPARYVSGYLWPGKHIAAQASHAWVDLYVPGLGWVAYDPANACRPTEAYVRVAVGLDYFDAPPTRGVRRGGSRHEQLDVTVEIDPE